MEEKISVEIISQMGVAGIKKNGEGVEFKYDIFIIL
jgi:hypothetical protein